MHTANHLLLQVLSYNNKQTKVQSPGDFSSGLLFIPNLSSAVFWLKYGKVNPALVNLLQKIQTKN